MKILFAAAIGFCITSLASPVMTHTTPEITPGHPRLSQTSPKDPGSEKYIPCNLTGALPAEPGNVLAAGHFVNAMVVRTANTWQLADTKDLETKSATCETVFADDKGRAAGIFKQYLSSHFGCPDAQTLSIVPGGVLSEPHFDSGFLPYFGFLSSVHAPAQWVPAATKPSEKGSTAVFMTETRDGELEVAAVTNTGDHWESLSTTETEAAAEKTLADQAQKLKGDAAIKIHEECLEKFKELKKERKSKVEKGTSTVAVLPKKEKSKIYRLDLNAKTGKFDLIEVAKPDREGRVYRAHSQESQDQYFLAYNDLSFGHPANRFFLVGSKVNLVHFGGPADKIASLTKTGEWRVIPKKLREEYRVHDDESGGRDRLLEPSEEMTPKITAKPPKASSVASNRFNRKK